MSPRLITAILVAIVLSLVLRAPPSASDRPVRDFAIYYGPGRLGDLAEFDLVILSPLLDEEDVRWLNRRGVLTVGYLSLTTVGSWEPWAGDIEPDWVVGELLDWGEAVVNACEPGWRSLLLEKAIPHLVRKGFKGILLDNVDVADDYPWMAKAIVGLIRAVRSRWPDLFLIQNRGFSILNQTASLLNAILYEDFGTYYNFTTNRYEKLSGRQLAELESTSEWLSHLRSRYGLLVLALGYADPSDLAQMADFMAFVDSLARRYGFIPYVSDVDLSYLNMAYAGFSFLTWRDFWWSFLLSLSSLTPFFSLLAIMAYHITLGRRVD